MKRLLEDKDKIGTLKRKTNNDTSLDFSIFIGYPYSEIIITRALPRLLKAKKRKVGRDRSNPIKVAS